jgi:peptidoglycan hydrolase-like protein with peptidoglycan-binding domain
MKKICIPLLILLAVFVSTIKSKAQKSDKSSKQVTIKIVTEEDGKKTVIDTTFTTADEAAVEAFLRDKGISNSPNPPLPPLPPLPPNPQSAPPAPPAPPTPGMHKEPSRKYEYSYKNTTMSRNNPDWQPDASPTCIQCE